MVKLKLKLQYFGQLMQRVDSLEKSLMLGKIEGRRGRQRMRRFYDIINSMNTSLSKLWEMVKDREAWQDAVHGIAKSWTWLRDRTTKKKQQNISTAAYVRSFWSLEEKMTIDMNHIFSFWWLWNILDFPCGSAGKESACSAEDLDSIPELERSPGEGKGYPLLVILSICLHNS